MGCQEIGRERKKKREQGQKRENYMNCRTQKYSSIIPDYETHLWTKVVKPGWITNSLLNGTKRIEWNKITVFFFFFLIFLLGFNILFIQYYSVNCRPSDHTVGRPRTEIRTRAGRPRGRASSNAAKRFQLFILMRIHLLVFSVQNVFLLWILHKFYHWGLSFPVRIWCNKSS